MSYEQEQEEGEEGEEEEGEEFEGEEGEFEEEEEQEEGEEVEGNQVHRGRKRLDTKQYESETEPEFDYDHRLIKSIRKMLLDNLNRERIQKDLCPFYIDVMTNDIAQEYSLFLKGNPHEP